MDSLEKKLISDAGVTEEQAKKITGTVSDYLKERVPHWFHDQVDHLIAGGNLSDSIKEKLKTETDSLRNKAEEVVQEVRTKAGEIFEKVSEAFSDKKGNEGNK